MKKIFLIILLFCSIQIFAQYDLGLSLIYSDITTYNIGVLGKYKFKDQHQFCLGLKYHINNDSTTPLYRFFYRNFYSENILNRIGLLFEYRFYFMKNKIVNPYLLYNFQYSRMGSKFKHTFYYDFDPTKTLMTRQVTLDPINLYENHIGIGLNFKLDDRIRFFVSFSGGATFFTDRRDIDDLNNGTATFAFIYSDSEEFSWLFNTGLTYPIGKEKSKKRRKQNNRY
jgi:hypothetical protein